MPIAAQSLYPSVYERAALPLLRFRRLYKKAVLHMYLVITLQKTKNIYHITQIYHDGPSAAIQRGDHHPAVWRGALGSDAEPLMTARCT